jgi:hypothetical protein
VPGDNWKVIHLCITTDKSFLPRYGNFETSLYKFLAVIGLGNADNGSLSNQEARTLDTQTNL